jgi:hydroxyacyl-ACP dehydratase HTD2-like protein with hotdog domain
MSVSYDSVAKGTELPARSYQVTRLDLVKYAGASGDFNVIHWNERAARSVGLPNVIAHGMYTMAQAGKFVTEWAGDPGAVTDFGVRFSAMVPVPDDTPLSGDTALSGDTGLSGDAGGATIEISGKVLEKLGDNKVTVDIVARVGGAKVLSRARATVRLP